MTYLPNIEYEIKKPDWIKRIEKDKSKEKLYNKISVLLLIVFILSILFFLFYKDKLIFIGVSSDKIIVISIILFSIFMLFNTVLSPKIHTCLAYYLYQIGHEIPYFTNDEHFLKKNQKYIKKCNGNVKWSYDKDAYFIGNIADFFNKIILIISQLNYIYSSGNKNEFTKDEWDIISSNFMKLGELIYNSHNILTDSHIELIDDIVNQLEGIPVKSKLSWNLFKESLEQKWYKLPYFSKFIIINIVGFIIFFVILFKLTSSIWPEQELGGIVILGTIALLALFKGQINRFMR